MRGRRPAATRWEEDNRVSLNPWAFLAVGGLFAVLAGLAFLIWLL
jgi:UDP-N-acetyl-D-mannosaminuronic acid transferase (WecB/TagA/CpsF family)